MRYGMENPDKVKNLVAGSFSELTELYLPLLLEMQAEDTPAVKMLDDGKVRLRHSHKAQQRLFDRIPQSVKPPNMKASVRQLSQVELADDIAQQMAKLVGQTSTQILNMGKRDQNR